MENHFIRTELLLGNAGLERLKKATVMICGIGGVGSYAAEAIARCGVGNIILVDFDIVDATNINRQLIALHSTVGRYKVDVMKERILDINPHCHVRVYREKISAELLENQEFNENLKKCDDIVEAIDDIPAKLELIKFAKQNNVRIISAMGAGNKLDPLSFKVSDLYSTKVCPLARIMRNKLKKEGIESLKVVYSEENPKEIAHHELRRMKEESHSKVIGSISFVPSAMGLIMARETIMDLVRDV